MPDSCSPVFSVTEQRAVSEFFARVETVPSGLIVEGEPGSGKTTVLRSLLSLARDRGFTVLSSRPSAADAVLAYASLADLLAGVDPAVWQALPAPQRLAIERVLLCADGAGLATDHRAVSAAFVAVLDKLVRTTRVIIAVDDLQWIDPSSARVVAFAARRVTAPLGVVVTVRADPDRDGAAWLQLSRPDAVDRLQLAPLTAAELHQLVADRFGHSFPRPTIVTVHEISGGNPFFAIELCRAIDNGTFSADGGLPATLADVVRARTGDVTPETAQLLLAVACLASPTVALVGAVLEWRPAQVTRVVEAAEDDGIVMLEGHSVRFSHPLLAHGVYTGASPSRRRDLHRRICAVVADPELKARHMALAAMGSDAETLSVIDAGARAAAQRGAPAAAAELLRLAIRLGGDTVERRIRMGEHLFDAGDPVQARAVLDEMIEQSLSAAARAEALRRLGFWDLLDGSSHEAAELLEKALSEAQDDRALRAQILIPLAFVSINVGQFKAAVQWAAEAVVDATRCKDTQLLSQALSMQVLVGFLAGRGFDEPALQWALELEDQDAPTPALLRPTVHHAELLLGLGELETARAELRAIRRDCLDRGEESSLMMDAFHSGLGAIWRADFAELAMIAGDAMERGQQLGGHIPYAVALFLKSALAAHAGNDDAARRDAGEALRSCRSCGTPSLVSIWPLTTLGFIEVSVGNHGAAIDVLTEAVRAFDPDSGSTEIYVAPFLPDAIEALTQLGRTAEAEPLVDALERNGRRLGRPWMRAMGARGRGLLLASQGDLEAADAAFRQALVEHEALPMPFERARTQLLLGRLRRRQRQKAAASATLGEALLTFEQLGTPLWSARTQAELARVKVGRQRGADELSASEQRTAELAAAGMTNRQIAATLYVSPKTVEALLARVYRKLAIHSRAELGRHMAMHAAKTHRATDRDAAAL